MRNLLRISAGILLIPLSLTSPNMQNGRLSLVPVAVAATCNYQDNLDEIAQSFIGRCCVGSINSEFPGEYYGVSLGTILREANNSVGNAKKAYKLLNDSRFRK